MRDLNEEVRYLGRVLGNALRDAGGAELFDDVEAMRTACKHAREAGADYGRVDEIVDKMDAERAVNVARAFTIYFRLVNLAEDIHRARVLRERERKRNEQGPVAESFGAVISGLREAGIGREDALAAAAATNVQCVFTAHPTEARRRTTERLLVSVRKCLERWDRTNPTAAEARVLDRQIRAAVEALWQHAPGRTTKPEVVDEVKAGLWYFDNIIFDAAPRMHRRFVAELNSAYTDEKPLEPLDVPPMLNFGSWMGGDRDGNPYVDEVVTERTLHLHRQTAVRRYERDLAKLVDHLAADSSRLATFTKLDAALARSERAVPEVAAAASARNPREPLRRLLTFMRERLRRAAHFAPGGYENGQAFVEDLQVVHDVLQKSGGVGLADAHLTDLIIRVRMFGFFLAQVDIREDARIHRKVMGRWLEQPDYADLSPTERLQILEAKGLDDGRIGAAEDDDLCAREHALLRSLPKQAARYGSRALHTYIISQCESATDVLEVLHMLQWAGVAHHFDIVPLFESRTALAALPQTLESLLQNPSYREHLRHRQQCQEVLLGYSDSMKEAGIMASRIDLLEAQLAATRVCKKHDTTLRFFHGRGGSVSRGGGPTHRAIRALPAAAFSGQMRITEQGETRSFHFGHPELATRYLEQMLGAALDKCVATRSLQGEDPQKPPAFEALARRSETAYRSLVESDELVEYFQSCSPAKWLGSLNIGSRPTRRKSGSGLDGLRAIPWVFSWSQNRHVITGWYGAGTALSELNKAELQALLRESPFFADMLDNIQMTLAKSDLRIGARYAALAPSDHVRESIFEPVKKEFATTVAQILSICEQDELLEHDPIIANSIALRNPYVDPLSFLQVRALKALSSDEQSADRDHWEAVCRITIQGIAAGLRNTG